MCDDKELASHGIQKLLSIFRREHYQAAANELPGYQTSESSTVTELGVTFHTLRTTIRKKRRA